MDNATQTSLHPDYIDTYKDGPDEYKDQAFVTLKEVLTILNMPEGRHKAAIQDEARNVMNAEANYLSARIRYLIDFAGNIASVDVPYADKLYADAIDLQARRWHYLTLRNILNGHTMRSAQAWVWKGKDDELASLAVWSV